MKPVSIKVPFTTVGNRRCLTHLQLMEDPDLMAFVERFPDSFEHDILRDAMWFIEPGDIVAKVAA